MKCVFFTQGEKARQFAFIQVNELRIESNEVDDDNLGAKICVVPDGIMSKDQHTIKAFSSPMPAAISNLSSSINIAWVAPSFPIDSRAVSQIESKLKSTLSMKASSALMAAVPKRPKAVSIARDIRGQSDLI
jgi:hypothetical protein